MDLEDLDIKWQKKRINANGNYIEYMNNPSAFDIEATSTSVDDTDVGLMYAWGFAIGDENKNHSLTFGRTWGEFQSLMSEISNYYNLNNDRRLVVYVHNLSYEFQFMNKYFNFVNQFNTDQREVMSATTDIGIEFRDSYILSGRSLKDTAEMLTNHKIEKLNDYLDYNMTRNEKTTLSDDEYRYIENDVLIVLYYIQEQIDLYKGITNIPNTNTGRVRKLIKEELGKAPTTGKASSGAKRRALKQIQDLKLEPESYSANKRAFMGGYVHSNPNKLGKTLTDVVSYDISSSYPSVIAYNTFPMTNPKFFRKLSTDEYNELVKSKLIISNMEFLNLRKREGVPDSFLSDDKGRSRIYGDKHVNNGRVVKAERLKTTLTSVDFKIVQRVYEWDKVIIHQSYVYGKGLLPTQIRKTVLSLYKDKTNFKGVKGKETDYLISKEMINSVYGMSVTEVVKPKYKFIDGKWITENRSDNEQIKDYNDNYNRTFYYPWGVFIASYARFNLWQAILAVGEDYVYSDTDSVKFENPDKHVDFFDSYNKKIDKRAEWLCETDNLVFNINLFKPTDKQGNVHTLGHFEQDGYYKRFKTLGAKTYVAEDKDNELEFTVSGIGKNSIKDFMLNEYKTNDRAFEEFKTGLVIPKEFSGKLEHKFIDREVHAKVTDYQGNTVEIEVPSGIYMRPVDFTIRETKDECNFRLDKELEEIEAFEEAEDIIKMMEDETGLMLDGLVGLSKF